MVGGWLHLTHTCLDLLFAVSVVSCFMHKPSVRYLGAVKRIMRYVARTINYGIQYECVQNFKLSGYTNSN